MFEGARTFNGGHLADSLLNLSDNGQGDPPGLPAL